MGRAEEPYLSLNVRLLKFLGYWPEGGGHLTFRMLVYFASGVTYFVGAAWEISNHRHDLSVVTETLDTLLCVTLTAHKASGLIYNKERFQQLVHVVQNNFFLPEQRRNPLHARILSSCERQSKILTAVFITLTFSTVAGFLVFPVIEGLILHHTQSNSSEEYVWKVPFKLYYPVDISKMEVYCILYVFHLYIGIIHMFFIPGHDNFIVSLMLHACAQFKILNENLENLRQNALRNIQENRRYKSEHPVLTDGIIRDSLADRDGWDTGPDGNNNVVSPLRSWESGDPSPIVADVEEGAAHVPGRELDMEMRTCLRKCVKHHQILIKFVDRLEALVNMILLDQFLSSSLIFCTTAFLMVVMPAEKAVSMIGLMLASMCQLFMYCFFGDRLKQQSEAVAMAAYFSQWYDVPEDIKKSLLIIMMGSQKPTVLTIGKFVDLSLDTFASALQGSYTYFTLLNEVNGE